MVRIQQLGEGAVGERRRHVAQLHEPVEPQLADAIEVPLVEPRTDEHVGEHRDAALRHTATGS